MPRVTGILGIQKLKARGEERAGGGGGRGRRYVFPVLCICTERRSGSLTQSLLAYSLAFRQTNQPSPAHKKKTKTKGTVLQGGPWWTWRTAAGRRIVAWEETGAGRSRPVLWQIPERLPRAQGPSWTRSAPPRASSAASDPGGRSSQCDCEHDFGHVRARRRGQEFSVWAAQQAIKTWVQRSLSLEGGLLAQS